MVLLLWGFRHFVNQANCVQCGQLPRPSPHPPPAKVVSGDNVPDDGSDVGIELGHQDTRAHNEDVQRQNMEEAEGRNTELQLS